MTCERVFRFVWVIFRIYGLSTFQIWQVKSKHIPRSGRQNLTILVCTLVLVRESYIPCENNRLDNRWHMSMDHTCSKSWNLQLPSHHLSAWVLPVISSCPYLYHVRSLNTSIWPPKQYIQPNKSIWGAKRSCWSTKPWRFSRKSVPWDASSVQNALLLVVQFATRHPGEEGAQLNLCSHHGFHLPRVSGNNTEDYSI